MKIIVNGKAHDTEAASVAVLLDELGYGGAVVATALNGAFLAAASRAEQVLGDGDRLEVLAPMQGG